MASPDPGRGTAAGIGWMLLTMFLFVSMDTSAKYLLQYYGVVQVAAIRFGLHLVCVFVFIRAVNRHWPRSNRPGLQWLRSALLFTTTVLLFFGLREVQLATASAILFLYPIFVTVLAIPLLGETVGPRRWLGVFAGFAGAVVILQPGGAGFEPAMLYIVAAALSNAAYQVCTSRIRAHDPPSVSLFYSGLVGALVTVPAVPFAWQAPALAHLPVFVWLGLLGIGAHLCLIRSFRAAAAAVVSPFSYSSILWSTGFGFAVFGEIPARHVWLGAALIIGSGLYVFHREQVAARRRA